MASFVTMPSQDGSCFRCRSSLNDGRPLLGHSRHVFHRDCILKMIRENSDRFVECPEVCGFIATRIDGEALTNYLERMKFYQIPSQLESQTSKVIQASSALNIVELQCLLSQGTLPPKDRGLAVVSAAQAGDDGMIISQLLKTGPILPVDRGKAAIAAMAHSNRIAFHKLVEDGKQIDENSFSKAILESVKNNQIHFLQLLLSTGKQVGDGTRGEAIKIALEMQAFNIVYLLLPEGEPVPAIYVEHLLKKAAELGRQDMLELFCRQRISANIMRQAISSAQRAGRSEIAHWLSERISSTY